MNVYDIIKSMKLSDFLINEIYKETLTDKFFGYIGGMIAHIADSIYSNKNAELVNTITEQGAGFAAGAYARITGKTGIAAATSGPGALNLITPAADCFFDSIPVLFITGQVNTYEYKKYNIRQCGFQETDIVNVMKPVTKYAVTVKNPNDIKYELQKALFIANNGRKGPVLLDIPMDIQRADIDENTLRGFKADLTENFDNFNQFNLIEKSKRLLCLAGNGINSDNSVQKFKDFLYKYEIPVVQTLHGISCIDENYKYNMGFIGTYGNRCGNIALYKCDTLLVLGARLDIRQTGADVDCFKNKTIIQADIDENELNCTKFNKIKVKSSISHFLDLFENHKMKLNMSDWHKTCLNLKSMFTNEKKQYNLPNIILSEIFKYADENTVITADVGQNQMWAAQSLRIKGNQKFITSGGLGSMGFSLPAAAGAGILGHKVFAITGDGGLQMNIQELEVIKRRNLPVKIIVMNNRNLGMVRTFQELYFENRFASTVEDYSAPDFEKIAKAYGIKAKTISAETFDINLIKEDLISNEPFLFNIILEIKTQVEPRLLFGNSIEKQHPIINLNYL